MPEQVRKKKLFFNLLKKEKGQNLVGFALIVAFCAGIGLAAREAGLMEALNDTYSRQETAFAASDIKSGETKVSGDIGAVKIGGGGTSSSGGGSGSGSGGSAGGVTPQTDPPQTDPPQTDPPQTDPPQTDPPQTDPPAGGGSNSTPGMPAGGGQTGGGSGNTGSGSTFEEKKAALEAKLKASAIPNDNNRVFNVGEIVKDGNDYKIVNNTNGGTWKSLVNYNIINLSSVLQQNGQQMYFTGSRPGDIVITDDGDVYFQRYDAGWTNYPQDLINQNSNWVKLNIKI